MKKPFSSDEGVLRYSESEKTAKKEQYKLQFSNKDKSNLYLTMMNRQYELLFIILLK